MGIFRKRGIPGNIRGMGMRFFQEKLSFSREREFPHFPHPQFRQYFVIKSNMVAQAFENLAHSVFRGISITNQLLTQNFSIFLFHFFGQS